MVTILFTREINDLNFGIKIHLFAQGNFGVYSALELFYTYVIASRMNERSE